MVTQTWVMRRVFVSSASVGRCLLSFGTGDVDSAYKDSGGPGTYFQLLIIKEYMIRLANDLSIDEADVYPADYFDLMGGVGFGGCVIFYIDVISYHFFRLVAILLGHLRMNVAEAIEPLLDVALAIFPANPRPDCDPETRTKRLSDSVQNILQTRGITPDRKMQDTCEDAVACKVYV
jgi:hypothetical protein